MLSASARASARRINDRRFTEADVRSLLIEMREHHGPVIREVGDLIAHPNRDRGFTYDHIIYVFSCMYFFNKYKGEYKQEFLIHGPCDWWLKNYMMNQAARLTKVEIKRIFKVNKKGFIREIKSYFPANKWPVKFAKLPDRRFVDIINLLGSRIYSNPIFDMPAIIKEMAAVAAAAGIKDQQLVDDMVVCLCLLFHGVEVALPHGEKGRTAFYISQDPPFGTDPKNVDLLRRGHGLLAVNAIAIVPYKDKTIDIMFPLINTNIYSDKYIDDDSVFKINRAFARDSEKVFMSFDKLLELPIVIE